MAVEFNGPTLTFTGRRGSVIRVDHRKQPGLMMVCIIDRNETKRNGVQKRDRTGTMTNVRQKDGQFYQGNSQKKADIWSQIPVFLYSEMWSMGQK